MKIIERSLNMVYELSKADVEAAIFKSIGLGNDYRLEHMDVFEGNDEAYAHVMIARDMTEP